MLKNKVIVITGGGEGLGKALAYNFATKDAHVVVSDIHTSAIKQIAEDIKGLAVTADVTKEDMKRLAEEAAAAYGEVDIWINGANLWIPRGPFEGIDMNRAKSLFAVNVFGIMHGVSAVLPQMKKQGSGIIVNIIATSALNARPYSAVYSSTKHAAKGFTDALREEVREEGIKVIGIYPGGMRTSLFDEKRPEDYNEFMSVGPVAEKLVENMSVENPQEEIVIRRPGQEK